MKNLSLKLVAGALTLVSLLTACGKNGDIAKDLEYDRDHEHEENFYLAAPEDAKLASDPLRKKLSYFFLVEQFEVGANGSMLAAIKSNPPGGVLFWNGNKADSSLLRDSITAYSKQAEAMQLKPLLFSTDYEGGALNKTPSGASIPGVQRFTKGFTSLAHPRWLGVSMKDYGTELCTLHGKIMSTELKAVGINYPLSVVSDLATQALTSLRAISKDPVDTSKCVTAILEQFITTKDLIFVTKHFPGLGMTRGDTHEGTVTSTITDKSTLDAHLKPFEDLMSFSKSQGVPGLLSVMTTHAKFIAWDKDHVTTESPKIVTGLLRGQLNFSGLAVSDAMWMGEYGTMKSAQLMPVYLNAFLSGLDMLMIPGARFSEAVTYFRKVYDGNLSADEKDALTKRTGMTWEETHDKFIERINQSLRVHDLARGGIKAPHTYVSSRVPTELTTESRARYNKILSDISSRGNPLPKN